MKNHLIQKLFSALLLTLPLLTAAEDIDLFIGQSPSASTDAPNLLLIIDNGASFSANAAGQVCRISATGNVYTDTTTAGADNIAANKTALDGKASAVEQCALYSVIKGLDTSSGVKVRLGIMFFNSVGLKTFNPVTNTFSNVCSPGGSSVGGCLGVEITDLTTTVKTNLLAWIKAWTTSGSSDYNIKGPANLANGATMQEAWAYYNGYTGISGRDYLLLKPLSPCGKNFIVFVGNDYGNQASPKDATGDSGPLGALLGTNSVLLKNANPVTTAAEQASITETITLKCTPASSDATETLATAENKGAYALNWARYMHNHGMTTYSIGITGASCDTSYAAHLAKLGRTDVGGGKYFQTNNYADLKAAMTTILSEIQAVNSVFAAVSLPVSVNTQGTYLNQVYIGMFRPDGNGFPRWNGNLKQYKLGMYNNDIKLQDADSSTSTGHSAINTTTGFITECARSYWTPNVVEDPGYWLNVVTAKGGCADESAYSNSPDGNIVEKGGHAYQLRQTTPTTNRAVKTCSPVFATCGTTSDLTLFDTANATITQAMLDSTSGATNRDTLINWSRGMNVADELSKGTSVMRPSTHGDVVHSRPVAINYGTDVAPSVVVFYGGNDGMLRAVNGNRGCTNTFSGSCPPNSAVGVITSGGNTYNAGNELWSFMPPEFYTNVKRLYDNTIAIKYKGSTDVAALPKPYGFDGPLTAFQGTISGTSKVFTYAAMRRGGRALYAFDVTTPGTPTMKWKKGCPSTANDTNCINDGTGDFTGIGQTWSSAKKIFASGYGSGASPMLIMGGGYDDCEDTDDGTVNHSCTASTKGHKIYVMDAADGSLLKTFNTTRGVSSDVTIVTDSTTGMAKFAYATDLGGNVYRISGVDANTAIGATAPASWTITKIASLGCDTVAACSANRKFMYAPDVVYDNGLYILLIGSGDREKPLKTYTATYAVANNFFMIKDDPSSPTWLSSESANCSGTAIICKNSLLGITTSTNPSQASVDAKKGWYLGLSSHEQVVTSSVSIFGTTTFSTHQPAEPTVGSCGSDLGSARVYNIAYSNAASTNGTTERYQDLAGDGLPPSPVAGQVTLDGVVNENGSVTPGVTVPFCIGCNPDSPLEGKYAIKPSSSSASQYKSRIYWYIQK